MAQLPQRPEVSSRAWYAASIADFLRADSDSVVGRLTSSSDFAVLPSQRDAWLAQIRLLQDQLGGLTGSLFMEFSIPRMGRRIDTVLVIGPIVFPVEFKMGDSVFDRSAIDQVWDYALDLKNFHEASHSVSLVPILVATGTDKSPPEDAATEFQVQGLELDWACVAWDGDLRFGDSKWNYHYFRGDRWCRIANPDNQRYLCNAYRVLLTRARQGMVIFVPPGDLSDRTRSPGFYDPTYQYLSGLGIPEVR